MAIEVTEQTISGFNQVVSGTIPVGLNKTFWVSRTNDILGSIKIYPDLEEFVQLNPNIMLVGTQAVINQHVRSGTTFASTIYTLKVIPEIADIPLSLNADDSNYYLNYWEELAKLDLTQLATVYEYAPDINGLKPPFPYIDNPSAEASWGENYEPGTSKWLRSRNTDTLFPSTSIYKDWSRPLPINGNFVDGDYTQNLFIRAAVTPSLPPALIDGIANNEPEGWADIPTVGTDPLYEIRGQKDKYGNLKSQWIGPFLIPEDEDLIRYNSNSTPNPNTIVNISTPATDGSQADTDLITAGWIKTFDPTIHKYRAKRSENAPNDYTTWNIDKISEESGEYIDRIYKLFPDSIDFDSLTFITDNTPTGNDPISNVQGLPRNEGWSDVQLTEGDVTINCYSEARKFIDGSLKTPWTSPRPFTGKNVYIDYIRSNGETSFKYANSDDLANNISDPVSITLTAFLFKGNNEVTQNLSYKWFKIYNNKNAIIVDPDVDTPLATTKDIVVTPTDIATKAIFRCYTTLAINGGDDLVFVEEESILDITDGDDAKSLTISSDTPIVLYDTTNSAFSVDNIAIRGFQNFLDGVTFYWYKDDGAGNWISLVGNADYTLANKSLSIATVDLFTANGNKENARFALSTSSTIANVEDVDEFYDIFTISKLSSAGVGAAGQDAYTIVLSNEVDSIILDRATGLPQAGEIGNTGTVTTNVSVYDGTTKLAAGTDYTITVADTEPDISFTASDTGSEYLVYIDTWTATTIRKVNAVITVTIGSVVINKNFTVSSNLDDAGALIGFVDIAATSVNKGLSFLPQERNPITLEAVLDQNGTKINPANFGGNVVWYFNNALTTTNLSGTKNINKTINRVDVDNNLSVKAKINYNNVDYFTTPVNIDDITDGKQYIAYHRYPSTIPAEPLAIPTKPSDITVTAFNALGNNDLLDNNFYPTATLASYWFTLGTVNNIAGVDTIIWGIPLRNRGEKGEQGDTPDFIVTYYKANDTNTIPTVPQSNASRDQMLGNEWFPAPALTTGEFIFKASNTFNGSDFDNTAAFATNSWKVFRETPLDPDAPVDGVDGNTIEYRYQSSATEEFVTFTNSDRSAGTGWSTTKPSIRDNNYIFETQVYINSADAIIGTWSDPILVSVSPTEIIKEINLQTINDIQYQITNQQLY